jgi:hypothetical protein
MAFAVESHRALSVIDRLEKLPEVFHLTGSRFFNDGKGNDVDYFVEASAELIDALVDMGFQKISMKEYGDSNCIAVMRTYDNGNLQIDVQIVKDAALKLRVQERLRELGYVRPTQNEWNLAFALMG